MSMNASNHVDFNRILKELKNQFLSVINCFRVLGDFNRILKVLTVDAFRRVVPNVVISIEY